MSNQYENRNRELFEILLELQVLVSGYEYIEPAGRPVQQFAILQAGPAGLRNG